MLGPSQDKLQNPQTKYRGVLGDLSETPKTTRELAGGCEVGRWGLTPKMQEIMGKTYTPE